MTDACRPAAHWTGAGHHRPPTYLVGVALIILLPGPNSLYVLSVATRRGVRSGYAGAAGVWTGDAVLLTLSAAGVASLLQANPAVSGSTVAPW